MSMPQERRAAVALLIGVALPLLIMGMHPTGGDITRGGARLVLINEWVHGEALAAQHVLFLGVRGVWRLLRSDVAPQELLLDRLGLGGVVAHAALGLFRAPGGH